MAARALIMRNPRTAAIVAAIVALAAVVIVLVVAGSGSKYEEDCRAGVEARFGTDWQGEDEAVNACIELREMGVN